MQTAIVLYAEKVESSATQFGREIEKEVQTAGELTDERLEEMVKNSQLMKDVEEAVRENAQRELDEYIGQKEDEAEENARDDLISGRRANLSEKVVVILPPFKRRRMREYRAEKISIAVDIPIIPPDKDIDDVSDGEFVLHDEKSETWDEYLPSLLLPAEEKDKPALSDLFIGGKRDILKYLKQRGTSISHVRELIQETSSSHILEFDYFTDGWADLCSLILEQNLPHKHSTRKRKVKA